MINQFQRALIMMGHADCPTYTSLCSGLASLRDLNNRDQTKAKSLTKLISNKQKQNENSGQPCSVSDHLEAYQQNI